MDYVAEDHNLDKRKTLRLSAYPAMEKALYTWFVQERARGTPLSGELISEKAKFFYQQLNLSGDFKASSGWLQKFKERYGIRQLTITGDQLISKAMTIKSVLCTYHPTVHH
ncbi:Tc5 transposase DNA-binding domain [Popillia japonica]|uniref:Tc5 transposase DNA-binding domain n=1 Tax=Popillia japonica TaxID=7064 RepID=A0AAW1IEU3_POPJA